MRLSLTYSPASWTIAPMSHWEGPRLGKRGGWGVLAVAGCLCVSTACGTTSSKSTTGGSPIDAGWQSGLADALAATPLYSLGFLDQGPILSAAFVSGAAGASCTALTSAQTNGGDTWVLGVIVPTIDVGVYPVVRPPEPVVGSVSDAGSDARAAVVYLEHENQDAGLKLVTFASGGEVVISEAPGVPGDQEDGGLLMGSLTYVAFPANPLAIGHCQDAGTGSQPQICICDDLYGNQVSICDGGPSTCCQGMGPTFAISLAIDAGPCAALCLSGPDIPASACESL
jgi:hypothetical protein